MILQRDYEDIYIGCEFVFDYRLAQIVAFTQVTFMYNIGLPMLFVISIVNFLIMYWIDKWLLLRFSCNPRNFDETTIKFTLKIIKSTFMLHTIVGFFMLSNPGILKTDSKIIGNTSKTQGRFKELTWEEWYDDLGDHVEFFESYMFIFLVFTFFETAILEWLGWTSTNTSMKDRKAVSCDYYEEIHPDYLIREYERTKLEKNHYVKEIEKHT